MTRGRKALIIILIVTIVTVIGFIVISKMELEPEVEKALNDTVVQSDSVSISSKKDGVVGLNSETPIISATTSPKVTVSPTSSQTSQTDVKSLLYPIPEIPESSSDNVQITTSMSINGYIYVSYKSDTRVKVMMNSGERQEIYDLIPDGQFHRFTLHLGDGDYMIRVVENTTGNSYRVIETTDFECKMISDRFPYLVPNSFVVYDNDMQALEFGLELTKEAFTDEEKAHAIYDWIVRNISYDFSVVGELEVGYVPNPQRTYDTRMGICSDFASLFASLCRSQGVPCKVVLGYYVKSEYYHAWNEVLINGEYIIVDTSGDSQTKKYNFARQDGYTKNKEH